MKIFKILGFIFLFELKNKKIFSTTLQEKLAQLKEAERKLLEEIKNQENPGELNNCHTIIRKQDAQIKKQLQEIETIKQIKKAERISDLNLIIVILKEIVNRYEEINDYKNDKNDEFIKTIDLYKKEMILLFTIEKESIDAIELNENNIRKREEEQYKKRDQIYHELRKMFENIARGQGIDIERGQRIDSRPRERNQKLLLEDMGNPKQTQIYYMDKLVTKLRYLKRFCQEDLSEESRFKDLCKKLDKIATKSFHRHVNSLKLTYLRDHLSDESVIQNNFFHKSMMDIFKKMRNKSPISSQEKSDIKNKLEKTIKTYHHFIHEHLCGHQINLYIHDRTKLKIDFKLKALRDLTNNILEKN